MIHIFFDLSNKVDVDAFYRNLKNGGETDVGGVTGKNYILHFTAFEHNTIYFLNTCFLMMLWYFTLWTYANSNEHPSDC